MKFLDRFFGKKTCADEVIKEVMADSGMDVSYHPDHTVCEKCGGFFSPPHVEKVKTVTVFVYDDDKTDLFSDTKSYCSHCAPKGNPIIFYLRSPDGRVFDERRFQVTDIFQDVDDEGEERWLITGDEFTRLSRLYCIHCGDYTHKEAAGCSPCEKKHGTKK